MHKMTFQPVHPEEVLQEEFLKSMGPSRNRLALDSGVPARRINEIVLRKCGVTADTALRLAQYSVCSPSFGSGSSSIMSWIWQAINSPHGLSGR